MTKGIFITGTDTDAGKTIVTAGLMHLFRSKGYNSTYFKAALSGALEENDNLIPGDTDLVSKVGNLSEDYDNITPYIYRTAVSPHLAAKIENNPIMLNKILEKFNYLKQKYDYIIAEGSGGIVCPLIDNEEETYLLQDLIKDLNMDVIIVAKAGVGTINHTVLTVKYIQNIGIKIKGIIISGYKNNLLCNNNIEMIKKLTQIPILGLVNWIPDLDNEKLKLENIKKEIEKSIEIDTLINCISEI